MLALEVLDLDVGYSEGAVLLRQLNLRLEVGKLVGLVGRNGMGKSTLLRTLAGDLPSLGGVVRYGGVALGSMSRMGRARMLSYGPSRLEVDGQLTVWETVMLGRYPHLGWLQPVGRGDRSAVSHALALTQLSGLADRGVGTLSDGERQRVNVALSLAQSSSFLLLDEPTSHLDVTHQAELLLLLRGLADGEGRAVLYSTHDVQGALSHADAVWLVEDGSVCELVPGDRTCAARLGGAFSTDRIRYDAFAGRFSALD